MRGAPPERFSTRGAAKASRIHPVQAPDGESKLTVRAVGGGPVRLFGVALERDEPGIVYDALGSHAAMAVYWQRQDPAHWKDQLALRDPALVVFQYGTNESDLWKLDREEYEAALAGLVDELVASAPGASVLVVSPLDRAESRAGKLVTKQVILDPGRHPAARRRPRPRRRLLGHLLGDGRRGLDGPLVQDPPPAGRRRPHTRPPSAPKSSATCSATPS